MFKNQLSIQMLRAIDEKELTLETLSEAAGLSRRFIGNIVNGKQVPTLDSFEKICSALELEPNDLLLSDKSKKHNKSHPLRVTQVYCRKDAGGFSYIPVCPHCNALLESENQS